jgi:deoxyribonuclease V
MSALTKADLVRARLTHAWDLPPEAAAQVQQRLSSQVITRPLAESSIKSIAGVDVGYPRGRGAARVAVAVLDYASLQLMDLSTNEYSISFPYIPGLLSFREVPAILTALEGLTIMPDLLITDGHGRAHPRRFGLACHLGVLLDLPTIGCAKSILIGGHDALPGSPGSTVDLSDNGEITGSVVRTRDDVKPVYVSVGHGVDLPSAVRVILHCCPKYRLPEPIRWAHRSASPYTTTERKRP